MKKEIRGQTAGRVRIDSTERITQGKCAKCRCSIEIFDSQRNFDRRDRAKQNRYRIPEPQVLRPLPHVKTNLSFPLADVATEKLDDPVFQLKSREPGLERLLIKHLSIKEPIGNIGQLDKFLIRHRLLARVLRSALKDRQQVGAFRHEWRGNTTLVVHLHQKRTPPLLHQFLLCTPFDNRDTAFRVNAHRDEA